mgnify:CR=1 FL=1
MKPKVLISGGTGLVGQAITAILDNNHYEVAYLSRSKKETARKIFLWNPEKAEIDPEAIEYADVIIHLAGENISSGQWTVAQKKKIISSRVESTKLLENAIQSADKKPVAFVSASAIGYYGSITTDKVFSEGDAAGKDFLAETVIKWENSVKQIHQIGIPTAILRIGVVMSKKGGALPKMLLPVKWGIGSAIGTGKQWVPWIALEDLARLFLFVIESRISKTSSKDLTIYNAVSPSEINNRDLMKQLAKALNKPFFMPAVPGFIFKMLYGEMSTILLEGSRVSAQKLQEEGFKFNTSKIEELFH